MIQDNICLNCYIINYKEVVPVSLKKAHYTWLDKAPHITAAILYIVITLLAAAPAYSKEGAMNRLANESSPYLLKHATNPVDWYPWGDEAFLKAKKEDKPIFLSIGYSTCHWCNVMEEESFSDPEVAALMNEVFVSIKVDREERPDIDSVYMSASILITGTGGWPLTILMTPDKKPFFAATYIPKHARFGRTGMMDFIPRVKEVWQTRREEVLRSSETIVSAMAGAQESSASADGGGEELGLADLASTYEELNGRFDKKYGGFGQAPKFPTPHTLMFLLRYHKRTGDKQALRMVETTLRRMRAGGIYDHLGYGFHRYSTDRMWLVPHFEKMLYDQAMLAMAYTEGYLATGKEVYSDTAKEIFAYVLRDMTSPEGGFYSAEDADSEGEEGKFYIWKENEIRDVLTKDEAELALNIFNIKSGGNYVDQSQGQQGATTGENILHLEGSSGPYNKDKKMEKIRKKLLAYREKRVRPFKDDKVLADWNGLMIAALAKGARALGDDRYSDAARNSADFLLQNMRLADGSLAHRWRGGSAGINAGAEDYAYLIWGLVELREATFDLKYLEAAVELSKVFLEEFWDDGGGGFFLTPDSGEKLITRPKEVYDGAVPSYNSVAMLAFLKLSRLTGNPALEERALKTATAFSGEVRRAYSAHSMLMSALDFGLGPSHEVVIVGKRGARDTEAMIKAARKKFVPNKVVLFVDADDPARVRQVAKFT
ncbi:hypothetical protein LCGC14_1978390, partial [marine sediment metagenome]